MGISRPSLPENGRLEDPTDDRREDLPTEEGNASAAIHPEHAVPSPDPQAEVGHGHVNPDRIDDDSALPEVDAAEGIADEGTEGGIGIRSIRARRDVILGDQISAIIYNVVDTFKWVETPRSVLDKNSEVFIGAYDEDEVVADPHTRRIILVRGKPHSGRYSRALQHAIALKKRAKVNDIVSLLCTVNSNLISLLLAEDCPTSCALLMRNGFMNPGISIKEIQDASAEITQLLTERNIYLFITHDVPIDYPSGIIPLTTLEFSSHQKTEILRRHLYGTFYRIADELKAAAMSESPFLVEILHTPHLIDLFCRQLSGKTPAETDLAKYLRETAQAVARHEPLDRWFERLDDDLVRYFAITVALFPDLEAKDLIARLEQDTQVLRTFRTKLDSVGDHGLDYLLEKASCAISNWGTIEFKSPQASSIALDQLHTNYFFHFWKLVGQYDEIVQRHHRAEDIEIRLAYARALGEIGRSDLNRLEGILRRWAQSEVDRVRAATGYALKQVCSQAPFALEVEQILRRWAEDHSSRLRWTAVAAAERLYSNIPRAVVEILTDLAADKRITGSIIHALITISRLAPMDVTALVAPWLNEAKSSTPDLRKLAEDASIRILQDLRPGSNVRRRALLPLAELLVNAEQTRRTMLGILMTWLEIDKHPASFVDVEELLMTFYRGDNLEAMLEIQDVMLTDWLVSSNDRVRQIALKLTGSDLPMPTSTNVGIVILDLTPVDEKVRLGLLTHGKRLAARLNRFVHCKVALLGLCLQPADIQDPSTLALLTAREDLHPARLIGPVLEQLKAEETVFVLVITSGEIIDLADWQRPEWANKIILSNMLDDAAVQDAPGFIFLSQGTEERIEALVRALVSGSL